MAKSVERQLLDVTGEAKRGEEESSKKYIARLVKKANALDEKDWDKLSEETQKWVNKNIEALNDGGDIVPLPAPPEDDEKPAKKKSDDDDDEKPMKARAVKKSEDDEDDEKPAKKKAKSEDDEDDEKPAKKSKSEDDEDDEKPKKKAAKSDDDDEPAKDKKPGAIPRLKELVIKNPGWSKAKCIEKLQAEGFTISTNTVGIAYYDVKNTLKACKRAGVLKGDYAEQIDETDRRPEAFKPKSERKAKDEDDEKPAKKKRDDDDD